MRLFLSILFLLPLLTFAKTKHYRVMWNDDPCTTATIGWNQLSGKVAKVYYDTQDHGTDASKYAFQQEADAVRKHKSMKHAFVRLTDLKPDTKYYFLIVDRSGSSRRMWFETASDDSSDRFSFIAGGDSRNNREPRLNANLLVAKLRADAVFFGGDMTNTGLFFEWVRWFDDWEMTIAEDGRVTPIVAARGNHESKNEDLENMFDTPKGVYYALTFGSNLFRAYTLNTESSISGDQSQWLEQDLETNNEVLWKMAQYHKPMRPHVFSKNEGNTQYVNWAPLFYQYQVQLVVECDAHTVKSTWPIRPNSEAGDEGFMRDDVCGTTYVGEGCWGAPLRDNDDNKSWTRSSGKFNQFKWIFVDQKQVEVRTVKVDNAKEVEALTDETQFEIPANLQLWEPSEGSVIVIDNVGC